MQDAASGHPPNQTFATTQDIGYDHPGLEAGLPRDAQGAVKGGFLHHALRLVRWLVRKFNELLIIALIGIPLGQPFLESQQKQQQQVAGLEWLNNVVLIWIAWVCVAIVLALDNFKYLAKNKFKIVKAAVAFCTAPTIDRFTTNKFADSNAVYPICLVLAAICPEIYRLWSPGAETENAENDENERLD